MTLIWFATAGLLAFSIIFLVSIGILYIPFGIGLIALITLTITRTSAVTALVPITKTATQTTTALGFSGRSTFFNKTTGLSLALFVNTSAIAVSSSNSSTFIQVDISEYNTLTRPNNVTAASDWKLQDLSAGSCNFESPTGIVIFTGYYTLENISKENSRLPLFYPVACPLGPLLRRA
jgi:hypothetical protein